jgi:hypothetical protein
MNSGRMPPSKALLVVLATEETRDADRRAFVFVVLVTLVGRDGFTPRERLAIRSNKVFPATADREPPDEMIPRRRVTSGETAASSCARLLASSNNSSCLPALPPRPGRARDRVDRYATPATPVRLA